MAIKRMNDAVLYVRDAEKTYAFYRRARVRRDGDAGRQVPPGAGLRQRPRSGLGRSRGRGTVDGRPADRRAVPHRLGGPDARGPGIAQKLTEAVRWSDGPQLDEGALREGPDGLEFEVCWIVPKELQTSEIEEGRARMRRLDIDAEIERYGLETVGGV